MNKPIVWASWVVVAWGIVEAKPFLVPLCLAALLCFVMLPIVDWLRRRRAPEWVAVLVAAILLFLPVLTLVALIVNEGTVLVRNYPQIVAAIRENWTKLLSSPLGQRLNLSDYLDASSLGDRMSEEAGKGVTWLVEGLKALAEAGAHLIIILFFAILMLAARRDIRRTTERLVRNPRTLDEITRLVERYLVARVGVAALVAVLDILILKAMGSSYSVLLGCLLGISTFVPIVGFLLGILPPLILAFALGRSVVGTGIMLALLYLVSTIESHFVTPKYVGRQLDLNLLATFIGLYAGELLWGIWGMVLVIPLLGIVRIILTASPTLSPWAGFLAEKKD